MKYNNKGFTLIEIIITLVIIGILVAFATPLYNKYQEKAMLSIAKVMLLNYIQELKSYNLKYGYLPENNEQYQEFERQMKINPNQNFNINKYYKVQYNLEKDLLVTIAQKENNFKSCIIMDINTSKMEKCKICTDKKNQQECRPI